MIYLDGARIPVIMRRFEMHWCAVAVEVGWSGSNRYLEVLLWQASIGTLGINQHLLYRGKNERARRNERTQRGS